ncbi:MAG: S-layer homology domain-containing protein [Clostridia bacterium]|nr:S-layer homology domain-containing protein [Clostridia bacterium]
MKKTSLFIAVIMLISFVLPVSAADDKMANALKTVKERIEIPAECTEFSSRTEVSDGKPSYYFTWTTKNDSDTFREVNVNITGTYLIDNYYTYGSDENRETRIYYANKKIPQVSRDTALENAKAFFEKANPAICGEFDFAEAETDLYGNSYNISVNRKANGIKVDNYVSFNVDAVSGKVTSFYMNYTENAAFPSAEGVIGEEKAESIFRGGALQKIYYDFNDGEMAQIVWQAAGFDMIDAFSGEKFDYSESINENSARAAGKNAAATDSAEEVIFTEEEIKELDAVAGLITFDEAEKMLRGISEFDLSGTEVNSARVYKQGERYVISLDFEGDDKWCDASINAKTGQLLNYWGYNNKYENTETGFDDDFIKKYCKDFLSRTKVKDNSYRVRVENGIEYPFDTIHCEKDKKTGKVTSFSLYFDEQKEFEMPEGLADESAIYDALYESVKPELCYVLGDKTEAKLIYELDTSGIGFIDAQTKKLLGYDGKETAEPISAREYAYTDISGHFAEEAINALAAIDVGFPETEFKPNDIITQKEYMALLSQCVYDYVIFAKGAVDYDKTAGYFMQRNNISEDEIDADAPLTRETALKYLFDSGVEEFAHAAKIEGIFKTGFYDEGDIDPTMLGHVAIAKGLHIINGSPDGNFYPKANVTRGEAAVMIYNYLK